MSMLAYRGRHQLQEPLFGDARVSEGPGTSRGKAQSSSVEAPGITLGLITSTVSSRARGGQKTELLHSWLLTPVLVSEFPILGGHKDQLSSKDTAAIQ